MIRKHNDNNDGDDDDVSVGARVNRAKLLYFDLVMFQDRSTSHREVSKKAALSATRIVIFAQIRDSNDAVEKTFILALVEIFDH